eukprot:m51a1_g1529 hypothetical protein (288) ;mRNA; f:498846-510069
MFEPHGSVDRTEELYRSLLDAAHQTFEGVGNNQCGDWAPTMATIWDASGKQTRFSRTAKLKVERWQNRGDDTGINGISIKAGNSWVTSAQSQWGSWGDEFSCTQEGYYIAGFRIKSDGCHGSGIGKDAAGILQVGLICKDIYGNWERWDKQPYHGDDKMSRWPAREFKVECDTRYMVSGIKTKNKAPGGDDVALVGLSIECSEMIDPCYGCKNGWCNTNTRNGAYSSVPVCVEKSIAWSTKIYGSIETSAGTAVSGVAKPETPTIKCFYDPINKTFGRKVVMLLSHL